MFEQNLLLKFTVHSSDLPKQKRFQRKFKDAEDAGTENGHLCSLILADGIAAYETSKEGQQILGQKRYGIYGLTDLSRKAYGNHVAHIPEIRNLLTIVGLEYHVDYSSDDKRKKLRYGTLMMLTKQNERGAYFKALIISLIYSNWPQLIRLRPAFLEEIVTPVVRVTNGRIKFSFFSLVEFERWKQATPDVETYTVRNYKGLGTNSLTEINECFSNLDFHRLKFVYGGPVDDESLMRVYDMGAINQLREWLADTMEYFMGHKVFYFHNSHYFKNKETNEVTYSEFIISEYSLFAYYDNVNSIPCIVDGFERSQRKIMFTCMKRKFKTEVTVAHLTHYVCEDTKFYEPVALLKDIHNMVHDFVGSNNVNLLMSFGQFGTRRMGGNDHGEHYKLQTNIAPVTRLIFHPHDEPLLEPNCDNEWTAIEPTFYLPVIPMLLVNGAQSTGTGWSTNIPKYDPIQLIRCLRGMMNGRAPEVLKPFYRNFRGEIRVVSSNCFITIGCVAIIENEKIEITELPIGTWTTSYKESVLEPLLCGSVTEKPIITEYEEFHSDDTVRFVISFVPGEFEKLQNEISGFHRVFQLYGIMNTDNMYAFDGSYKLRKYETAEEILQEFYDIRLKNYVRRKQYFMRKLTAEADKLQNQARFVMGMIDGTLDIKNRNLKQVMEKLIDHCNLPDPVERWKRQNGMRTSDVREEFDHLPDYMKELCTDFDYLLSMPMWALTEGRKNELISRRDGKIEELRVLREKTEQDLWLEDLQELEKKLYEEKERENVCKYQADKNLSPSEGGKKVEFQLTDDILYRISLTDQPDQLIGN